MATQSKLTFVVPGVEIATAGVPAPAGYTVTRSVRIGGQRSHGASLAVSARPGRDVVVLTLKDGPPLVLHPEDARDLLLAQRGTQRSAASAGADVDVPAGLGWPGLEAPATRDRSRGWLGDGKLLSFDILTASITEPAARLAAAGVTRAVDARVREGLYLLSRHARPGSLKSHTPAAPAQGSGGAPPMLVLVHGTFVDTDSTFGKLWTRNDGLVDHVFDYYRDKVYALDHATLGASPIANALTIARSVPTGTRLHLLTHSRGGLVAEVLARVCSGDALQAADLAFFDAADYAGQRAQLQELAGLAAQKGLRVERVVRVACPARGTLLASGRLDAYLSVFKWLLEKAGGPVIGAVADFLHEVARRRAKPEELPGLEAMMPERPLVNWLNDGATPVGGELRVIAGDMEGDSLGSWIKTLMADAFYWTDNDMIVQTRSMYGGFPRKAGSGRAASFMLDQGGAVSHFSYFSNGTTASAIGRALTEAEPAGFQPIGPLSWAGEAADGKRAGAPEGVAVRGGKGRDHPAVFVLPGILGSNIERGEKRLWVGFRLLNGFDQLVWDEHTADQYHASSPVRLYDDLIGFLQDTHQVFDFAYDWRAPMEKEARRLAGAIDEALEERKASKQPVRIVAHSMGGLLARTMQLEAPETWERMMRHPGARLLMLGTPNGGSWAPMQTLSGDDRFGNALAAVGSLFNRQRSRKIMAGMPGFIQLQAGLLDPALKLDNWETWDALAREDERIIAENSLWHAGPIQRLLYGWSAPPRHVLAQATSLRRRLDEQVGMLAQWADRIALVVGRAALTPAGYLMGSSGLEYTTVSGSGDGRVTLESAMLPGIRTWVLDAEHGNLPQVHDAFHALHEILESGSTTRLPDAARAVRGQEAAAPGQAPAGLRQRPSRGSLDEIVPADPMQLVGVVRRPGADKAPPAVLRVTVCNGDIRFVHSGLMLGHYQSSSLSGSEGVVDAMLGKAMSESLAASLYPHEPGSYQIFRNDSPNPANPLALPRPPAVIVIGLGAEGKLRSRQLMEVVQRGVIAYAQHLRQHKQKDSFDLAATLIGSGGTHVTVATAAMAVVQGVLEANQRLQAMGWPSMTKLTIIELYLDRACEALRAIQIQEKAMPQRLRITRTVQFSTGALRRPVDSGYRGANWDFISALAAESDDPAHAPINYVLDTRRARTEVTAQRTQVRLLRELVHHASNEANVDARIRHTLFNLLIPIEIEPYLSGSNDLVIELNAGTAGIPWELLDTRSPGEGSKEPWAVRSKLVRKLQRRDFRAVPRDAVREDAILIVGQPASDYPPLPGARREAEAVYKSVTECRSPIARDKVNFLPDKSDAQTIINALFERDYRIIHIAGHGKEGPKGGVVLSGRDIYLGADEVKAMRVVPELVFLNCCHLAARDASTVGRIYDRAAFAANIADALIGAGVRCVIAAGWAVDDNAADVFARTFYEALLAGERFIDAVGRARKATWEHDCRCNTWAAYQCYGDPDWTFHEVGAGASHAGAAQEEAGVASHEGLILLLENITYENTFGHPATSTPPSGGRTRKDRIDALVKRYDAVWGHIGVVAQALGHAYESAEAYEAAMHWYRRAIDADDGTASFKVHERLATLLVRHPSEKPPVEATRQAIELLQQLVAIHPTASREHLLGMAYKRRALALAAEKQEGDERTALRDAAQHFASAAALAGEDSPLAYEAAKSGIGCLLRLAFRSRTAKVHNLGAADRIREVQRIMERQAAGEPDFRNVVGQTELQVYEAVTNGGLAPHVEELRATLRELKERVKSPNDWRAVAADTEFVLEPYAAKARDEEVAAAQEVLKLMRELAASV